MKRSFAQLKGTSNEYYEYYGPSRGEVVCVVTAGIVATTGSNFFLGGGGGFACCRHWHWLLSMSGLGLETKMTTEKKMTLREI